MVGFLFFLFFSFFSHRSILFSPNFLFFTINCEKMFKERNLRVECSSITFFVVTVLLPMASLILLIRTGPIKDGQMNFPMIASSSSLTEKCVNNFRVVEQIMVVALELAVMIARRINVRKSPMRATVGLVNVCFILKNLVGLCILQCVQCPN